MEPGPVPVASGMFIPRPHQEEAAQAILRAAKAGARGFLLADEVGLGKTISALAGVIALREIRPVQNLLIVTPLSVVSHWRRTVADLGLADNGFRVCVINYDRLKKLVDIPASAQAAKRTRTKNKKIAKDGTSIIDWDVVIFDESHRLRNTSQRRSLAERIAAYSAPRAEAPFILWLSATSGSTPNHLGYLAPLLAQITKSQGSSLKDYGNWLVNQGFHVEYEERFDRWTWTDNLELQEQDTSRMKAMLFDRKTPVALRRLPTDIAGWPEMTRILMPVELTVPQRYLYEQAWTEFRREMNLSAKGGDPHAGLVAQLRFRQKASLIRVEGTIDITLDMLASTHQVVVSVQFLESLDTIREGLEKEGVRVAVFDGRDPLGREEHRLAFQRGQADVILTTPVEGYSLHQKELLPDGSLATDVPRVLLLHDVRFGAIDVLQAEGRAHRDGQNAFAYYLFSEDTVEEKIAVALLRKIQTTKALVGDDTATVKELEAILLKG
jgi:SNF2 family DNA or RNA helicase